MLTLTQPLLTLSTCLTGYGQQIITGYGQQITCEAGTLTTSSVLDRYCVFPLLFLCCMSMADFYSIPVAGHSVLVASLISKVIGVFLSSSWLLLQSGVKMVDHFCRYCYLSAVSCTLESGRVGGGRACCLGCVI